VVDVAGAVEATRLNPARGVRTHLGSFNAGDAGSLAVATPTNRARDSARRSPQIGDGEKLNGERGECHIAHEALVLKVWQETVPNWERTRCCEAEGQPSTTGNLSFYFRRVKSNPRSARPWRSETMPAGNGGTYAHVRLLRKQSKAKCEGHAQEYQRDLPFSSYH
jgi:hypothetical protein